LQNFIMRAGKAKINLFAAVNVEEFLVRASPRPCRASVL